MLMMLLLGVGRPHVPTMAASNRLLCTENFACSFRAVCRCLAGGFQVLMLLALPLGPLLILARQHIQGSRRTKRLRRQRLLAEVQGLGAEGSAC